MPRLTLWSTVALCCLMECAISVETLGSLAVTTTRRLNWTLRASQQADTGTQEAQLREAVRREPNNFTALARLGAVLAIQNKFEESAQCLEKALQLNAGDLESRRSLATDYWQIGQSEKARANLEIVLKAKPADSLAMLLLGMVS